MLLKVNENIESESFILASNEFLLRFKLTRLTRNLSSDIV